MSVLIEIKNQCGHKFYKNYTESAPMFRAKIETGYKLGYFIESSQFVSSRGVKEPRIYKLKCISEGSISTVHEFSSKTFAMRFFDNLKRNKDGGVVITQVSELDDCFKGELHCWYKNLVAKKDGELFTIYHYVNESDYEKASAE